MVEGHEAPEAGNSLWHGPEVVEMESPKSDPLKESVGGQDDRRLGTKDSPFFQILETKKLNRRLCPLQ